MKNLTIVMIFSLIQFNMFSQYLGINIATPVAPLHVSSNSINPEQVVFRADGDDPNYAIMMVNATNATAIAGYSIFRNGAFFAMMGVNVANDFFIKVGSNLPNAIYAKSSDNHVGINTTNPLANLDVNGTLKLGVNGNVFTNIIKVSVTVDVPSIPLNSSLIQSFTVANATVGGVVSISPDAVLPIGILLYDARVSAANTVEVTFRNTSQTLSANPVSMAYHIAIIL